ncbi:MAG: terminase family protein [Gemmatimonadota bacterium]
MITDWKNPDYEPIYRRRNRRLDFVRLDGSWDTLFAYYKTHPVDAIEDWVVTFDPRLASDGRPAYVPFILFPKQHEFIAWLWERFKNKEEGVVEKSRAMGASWLCIAFAWWLWMFYPGVKISFGSRVERDVDRIGDPDSLFEKFRLMMRRLPDELQPAGWDERDHAPFLKLINPENGNTITGEGGKQIGRGGRSTIYFVDEAAFIEYPDAVDKALSENTDCKIYVSTPNGTGNPFYRKRFGGKVPVFTFYWKDDPRKDEAWYEKKVRTLEPETVAQEIDLDYEASAGDVTVPAAWARASQLLRRQFAEDGLLPTITEKSGIGGLDVAAGGVGKSVFVPRYGPLVGQPTKWTDGDTINTAGRAQELAGHLQCYIVKFDSIGVGRGVSAALRRMEGARCQGVNVGDRPTRDRWPDGKRSKNKFVNLKAELWWIVRDRLRRTYEHWLHLAGEGGIQHELDDLLLLPDDSDLCSELSLPRYSFTETGKIQIESKRQLAARGIASPDSAEALILTYAPSPARKGSNRAVGLW